ncbi:MAG: M50 family metallopeptidase [Pseudonocardiaceae bacterium]
MHEAGHALVAASRGLGVSAIELHSFDGDGGTRLSDKPQELDRVWVLYGGPFAEKVVFRKWQLAAIPPELDELLMAHGLCHKMGIRNTREIMDQVEEYLREHQDQLELIATRLLETNTLRGAELTELLSEPLPS